MGIERDLADLERRTGELETKVAGNSDDIKNLETTFNDFSNTLSGAETELDILELKQDEQDNNIGEAESGLNDAWTKVNKVEQDLIDREENSLTSKGGVINGPLTAKSFGVKNPDVTIARGINLLGGAIDAPPKYGAFVGSTVTYGKHGQVQGDIAMYLQMTGATNRGWIFKLGNNNVASISGTGDFRIDGGGLSNTDMRAYSDRRLKREIKTIPNALEKICSIGGYTFTRVDKENSKRYTGVIAQELLKVLPEVVTLDEERQRYAVAYGNIVGLLIQGIKEQNARIDAIEQLALGEPKS